MLVIFLSVTFILYLLVGKTFLSLVDLAVLCELLQS